MIDQSRLLFIHGLEGSSQGYKATLLRERFPDMLIPDFPGEFEDRMAKLRGIVGDGSGWTLIGSSLGGLMATALALERPSQIARLILLAPALPWLPADVRKPLDMPVTVYHGRRDELVSLEKTREVARQIFTDLRFDEVDDDHGLGKTAREIDWAALLED